jgi:type IV/VI secretion system ImpK/VasF family protein
LANVRELFAKLFDYVLLFQQVNFQAEPHPSYEKVRSDIATLLAQQEVEAKHQGMLDHDYQDARFAIVAWADETILRRPDWEHHKQWRSCPLQLEYFQTRNAGEEVFERLERLRSDQVDAREIYYLSLGLGYTGRYFLGLEDELKLAQLRRQQAQHLSLCLEDVPSIGRLTPQPYQAKAPAGKPIKPPLTHLLLKAALALLVVSPLVMLVTYRFFASFSHDVPQLSQAMILQQIAAYPQRCTEVAVDTVDGKTGKVTLTGRVASETQRTEIITRVQNLEGVTQVQDTFRIIPPRFCAVVELLTPFRHQTEAQQLGLSIRLNKGLDPIYQRGKNLVLELQSPTAFASHVYVDYYTADGSVGHLLPNPREPANLLGPNRSFTVGRLDGPQLWKILPPFGLELVTVIASKTPIFEPPRFDSEPAMSYLHALRQALEQMTPSNVAATFSFLTTQDRP